MKFLLDTDVVVLHMSGREKLAEKWLVKGVGISLLTLGELYYGVYKSQDYTSSMKKLVNLLEELSIKIIIPDEKIIDVYAQEKVRLEKIGKRLDEFDLLIGATAIERKLSLVTKNKKHFERMNGLQLEE